MPVVDSHIHLLPGRLAEKVRAHIEAGAPEPLAYPIDHGIVRERLAEAGVAVAWTLPYAHKAGVAEGLNDASAEVVTASAGGPVTVVGGATVHPDDPDPVATVRRAVDELGLRVVKLHCNVGRYECLDARLDGFWAWVSEHRVPVVIHAGHSSNGFTEEHELAAVDTVATRFPEARVVIAHCAHRAVPEALALLRRHEHVYADLTPVLREPVAIGAGEARELAPKLLFGSDAPNVVCRVDDGLARVRGWGLAPAATEAILGGTAARLVAAVR